MGLRSSLKMGDALGMKPPGDSMGGFPGVSLQQLSIPPFWKQYGATQYIDFTDGSKIQPGATSTDIAGWDDSAETNVKVGPQLVTSGTFDTQADFDNDWGPLNSGGTWDITGSARILSAGESIFIRQDIGATIGGYFLVEFDAVFSSGSGIIRVGLNSESETIFTTGHHSLVMKNTGTDGTIIISRNTVCDFTIDNLTVYELDPATVAYDLTQPSATNQPTWVQGYDPTSPQLVTNGTFDTDLSGWIVDNDITGAVVSGEADFTVSTAGDFPDVSQSIYTTEDKDYILKFDCVERASNTKIIILPRGGGSPRPLQSLFEVGSNEFTFSYDSTVGDGTGFLIYFEFSGPSIGDRLVIDNVSLFEAVENDSKSHALFDGVDDYLEGVPTQAGDFTYVAKFNTSDQVLNKILFGSSINNTEILYINTIGNLVYRSSLNINKTLSGIFLDDGADHTIAVTRNGSTVTGFIDGVEATSVTDAGDFLVSRLGARQSSLFYKGKIFIAEVYNMALTASEISNVTAELNS